MMLTKEFEDALEIVCEHCAYISDCTDNEELAEAAYAGYDMADAGDKYCENCMVRLTYNLYYAMDKTDEELPYSSPEWQAIINY